MFLNFYILTFNGYNMKPKKYTFYFIVSVAFILTLIATINYIVDPYWTFPHSNILNSKQIDFNERQQKTNYLYFVDNNYDGLLLGSSRSTYINQTKLKGNIFNYAANGMYPYEYRYYIETFQKITKKSPKTILLGMDFFGSDKKINRNFIQNDNLNNTKEFLYKYKLLVNYNIIKYSIKDIKQHIKVTKHLYNRHNIKNISKITDIKNQIKKGLRNLKNYEYDTKLIQYFIDIKNSFPKSTFIIYTTPVAINQFKLYMDNDLMDEYFLWLENLINIFGEVNNFMIIDSHTKNINNFFDSNHATPKLCDIMAKKINNEESNFGIKLNKENFQEFKKNLKRQIKELFHEK